MNYYPIIIGLVALGGLIVSAWGWRVMQQSQRKKQWPTVEGVVTRSESTSELDDLLPHIEFRYTVNGQQLEKVFEFPEGTNPMPEFNQAYIKKYPSGKKVQVFYNPESPTDATLEPATQGDWMIFALGLLMFIGATLAFMLA